jgi:hypothetical protein
MSLRIEEEYFNVYEKNVSKIGMLRPPLNHLVPTFYTYGKALLDEIKDIQQPIFQQMTPTDQRLRLTELQTLFRDTIALGLRIQGEIRTLYPKLVE